MSPKRQVRYLRTRVKGQPFTFDVVRVQYRDSKGKLSKFTTRKKLKPEAVFATEAINKRTGKTTKKYFTSKKHTLPLLKRKKPISLSYFSSLIRNRLHRESRLFVETEMVNMYRFTYLYNQKRRTLKKVKREKKADIIKRKVKATLTHIGKGSSNGRKPARKTRLSKHKTV